MAHRVGKIVLSNLENVVIADVEYDDEVKKCVCIPIADNGIIQYKDEWQLWYRSFAYANPTGKFTHFLMKYIPKEAVKKMSQAQLEKFSKHAIGAEKRVTFSNEGTNEAE